MIRGGITHTLLVFFQTMSTKQFQVMSVKEDGHIIFSLVPSTEKPTSLFSLFKYVVSDD